MGHVSLRVRCHRLAHILSGAHDRSLAASASAPESGARRGHVRILSLSGTLNRGYRVHDRDRRCADGTVCDPEIPDATGHFGPYGDAMSRRR